MSKAGVNRNLPNNAYEAATGANNPNGTNVYATLADLFQQDGLIDGSAVWSGSGFIYDVTNLVYRIGGVIYTATATQVTLTAADPTLDRIDLIVVDTAGVISVKTGVPAPAPVAQPLDVDEVLVATVFVGAGTTAPVITIEALYDENAGSPTEWVGTSDDLNVTFASVADPNTGTVSIETTLPLGSNKYIQLAKGSPYTIVSGGVDFYIKAKQTMSTPSGQLYIGFYVGGSLVGNSVYIGGSPANIYGFDPTNTSTYQLVSIPITAFGVLPTTVDAIRFFKGPGSTTAEFFLDSIEIQEGAVAPPVSPLLPSLTELHDWVGDNTNTAVERKNAIEPLISGSSPTANTDETLGYRVGSMVFDFSTIPELLWICMDATTGAAQWKVVNNEVIRHFQSIGIGTETGQTWGTNTVLAAYASSIKFVAGANITVETSTPGSGNAEVKITSTGGGGGGSVWTPPKIGIEDITTGNTAPLLLSGTTGVRYVYFTDSTTGPGGVTDPTIEFTKYMGQDDGNEYDGSALSFRIHYQLFNTTPTAGSDNVRWSPQIYFIREGNDNINTAAPLGNPVDMNVLGKTPNTGYSEILVPQFNTSLPAGVRGIRVILRRLNSDAADTYPNDIDLVGIEIIN